MAYLFNETWQFLFDYFASKNMSRTNQKNYLENFTSTQDMFTDLSKKFKRSFDLIDSSINKEIRVVTYLDEDYPKLLKEIDDPPVFLFLLGNDLSYKEDLSISIVGSRHPTSYGEKVTKIIIDYFNHPEVTIVSGMAIGIDSIAQKNALSKEMNSIAVLGSGPDICYPKSEYRLYENLIEKGSIISEYPPGTEPKRYHFPRRNRIISGLSKQLIVTEAGLKSGTMHTAQAALDQGRDVYAIPGSIFMKGSQGCHQLINEGAKIIMDLQDMSQISQNILSTLNPQELNLIRFIGQFQPDFLELEKLTGLALSELLVTLGKLESQSFIKQENSRYFLEEKSYKLAK